MDKATAARFFGQAAIWGASFTFIKFALEDFSPNQLVLFRLILGAATLAAIILFTGRSFKLSATAWFHVAVSSIFANVVPYLLLSFGEQHTSAGLAGVLIGGTPLVTLFISTLALRAEPATPRKVTGFFLGFLGVALVVSPWKVEGSSLLGALACFGAAASYAVGYAYVSLFLSPLKLDPITLGANQLISAAVLLGLALPFFAWPAIETVSVIPLLSLLYLGVLASGFANILYFRLIQDVGAATASAVDYVVPVFAVLFGAVLLLEPLSWNVILGGAVILIGMAIAEGRIGSSSLSPVSSGKANKS
ncbi:DMT family transporter [Rhizobium rhizogenes]|uniref:DMT family transporter n=1 Tax=Rhizobium rhizogenes TaxID=359 RepID=UPI00080FCFE6|nr:DMT family transporter [Rhizobium rhizogenes]NTI46366.1 DMT family transporter [Rhizobium rhizogenes]OCJ22461.1 transporter [Agrobacterium sp. B131/95]